MHAWTCFGAHTSHLRASSHGEQPGRRGFSGTHGGQPLANIQKVQASDGYMCAGEIVRSIWMSSGLPWCESELSGYCDWGICLVFADGLCQCARPCSEPCGLWGEWCASRNSSNAIQPMASISASFTQQCYARGDDNRYLRDYWDKQ